jgi:quinol monooxygenase YgiN
MVVEYTRYRIPAKERELFVNVFEQAADFLSASPHCLSYELSHCVEDRDSFILRIEWTSLEENLGFCKEAGFREFFRLIRPFADYVEEMNHYGLTGVVLWKGTV